MSDPEDANARLVDLADGVLEPSEWAAWLAANPDAAQQVAAMQQVRALLQQFHTSTSAVPDTFDAQVLTQAQGEQTLRDLVSLHVLGSGRVLHELFALGCSFLPAAADQPPGTST